MDYLATGTDLRPLLSGGSPSCDADFSEPLSPAAADVVSHLVLDPQPPAQVRANDALPIVALLTCDPAQHQNLFIAAFATLLNHIGEELPGKLLGNTIDYGQRLSPTKTKFCFTLAFPDPGKYRFRITLQGIRIEDDASWLHVNSDDIIVTLPSENNWDLFEDVYDQHLNQDSEGTNTEEAHLLVLLPCREVDDSKYTYDTDLFPWKMSISPPPKVVVGGIAYDQHMVAEILGDETDIYDDEIDENEERSLVTEDEILDGDDGRKYRRGIGCFQQNYVALRREVVIIDTVRHIAHLVLHESEQYLRGADVLSVALSPDSTRLAEGADDNMLNIWDTDTGALLLTLEGHTAGVCSVAFSPDGMKIASGSYDKTLNIWDTDTGDLLLPLEGHTAGVFSVVFSPDGTKIASASNDNTLNIWDTDTGALLLTLEGHTAGVFS
ncbi:hypothetical protein VE00_09478 [Pseudogymnoascus sp. WSF 3629]|nr:hypothetical protein VE00_09478 [Pseudogymnoascus sp. WSF 3629]